MMDPPSFFPETPGPSVFAVSPERLNGTHPLYGSNYLAQSPSMPSYRTTPLGTKSPSRNNTDAHVHAMATSFEQITIKDHDHQIDQLSKKVERTEQLWMVMERDKAKLQFECEKLRGELEAANVERKKTEKEYKHLTRMHKAQSDASEKQTERFTALETAFKAAKDEIKNKREQLKTSYENGTEAVKRLEVVKTELKCTKDALTLEKREHEKSRKRSSKETLRTSHALLNAREELKSVQKTLTVIKVDYETEKRKRDQLATDLFQAQYQRETFESTILKLQDSLKVVEAERDALKETIDKHEVEKIAAAGCIALPGTLADDDEFALEEPGRSGWTSPRKSPVKQRFTDHSDKENSLPPRRLRAIELQEEMRLELRQERLRREKAEEQVSYMKMECQFRVCSCRIAELHKTPFIHDSTFDADMERIKASVPVDIPPESESADVDMDGAISEPDREEPAAPEPKTEELESTPEHDRVESVVTQEEVEPVIIQAPIPEPEQVLAFCPTSGTFRSVSSPEKSSPKAIEVVADPQMEADEEMEVEPTDLPSLQVNETEGDVDEDDGEDDEMDADPESTTIHLHPPETPSDHHVRTITTTIKIPLAFSPSPAPKSAPLPPTPSTISHPPRYHQSTSAESEKSPELDNGVWDQPFDRAAALEAIRQRRGRARSMALGNMTPRKQMLEGPGAGVGRRDISAPAIKGWK